MAEVELMTDTAEQPATGATFVPATDPNAAAATCAECGFALDSELHIRGIGLHGHTRTTKAEADAQRADVMRRAHEFAQRMQQEEAVASVRAAIELLSPEELAALLADAGVAPETPPATTEHRKGKGS